MLSIDPGRPLARRASTPTRSAGREHLQPLASQILYIVVDISLKAPVLREPRIRCRGCPPEKEEAVFETARSSGPT